MLKCILIKVPVYRDNVVESLCVIIPQEWGKAADTVNSKKADEQFQEMFMKAFTTLDYFSLYFSLQIRGLEFHSSDELLLLF